MYRIIEGRGTGKTSRLMLIAKENNATFVCANPYAMEAKAHAYGIVGLDFVDYHTYLTKGKRYSKVVIDELESLLKYTALGHCGGSELVGYTISVED